MNKLRLLIDMDSVLADLSYKWYGKFNARHKRQLDESVVHRFDFWPMPDEDKKDLFAILDEDGFFRDLPVIKGSQGVITALQAEGYEVIVVTTPPGIESGNSSVKDKLYWLDKHFPSLRPIKQNTVFTGRKSLVMGHLLFDDAPHNLEDFRKSGGFTCAMDYPYNRDVVADFRVINKDWYEFYRIVLDNNDMLYRRQRLSITQTA